MPKFTPLPNFGPTPTLAKNLLTRQNFVNPRKPHEARNCLTQAAHGPTQPTKPRNPWNFADLLLLTLLILGKNQF